MKLPVNRRKGLVSQHKSFRYNPIPFSCTKNKERKQVIKDEPHEKVKLMMLLLILILFRKKKEGMRFQNEFCTGERN
jgi:hypothetical protein